MRRGIFEMRTVVGKWRQGMRASVFGVLVAVATMGSGLAAETLAEGNAEYAAGDYAAAVEGYQALIAGGTVGAEIYYNLANALEKAGEPVEAALNYQRALILDPGLRPAHNNLALLAAERAMPMPKHTWVADVVAWVHPEVLINVGTVLGWVGMLGLVWVVFGGDSRAGRVWRVALMAGIFVVGSALAAVGWVADPRIADANLAMVTAEAGAKVRAAPATNSDPVAELPAGSSVGVLSPRGTWTYVALANGGKGWVPTDSLTMVVPGRVL